MMGFGFVGLVLMFLFWAIVIVGAILVVRSIFPRGTERRDLHIKSEQSAREILDQRYAQGEITREQYQLMISDLQD